MMLQTETVDNLRVALERLVSTRSAAAWSALGVLGRLAQEDLHLIIDFAATRTVGAPVVLAMPLSGRDLLAPLSPRRRQVAELMLTGASNKQIARDLGLSVATVKDHVHDILTRLGMPTRAALIAAAAGR